MESELFSCEEGSIVGHTDIRIFPKEVHVNDTGFRRIIIFKEATYSGNKRLIFTGTVERVFTGKGIAQCL